MIWTLKCDKHAKKKKKSGRGPILFHTTVYILYYYIWHIMYYYIWLYSIMENTLLIRDTYMLYHVTVCEHVRFVWVCMSRVSSWIWSGLSFVFTFGVVWLRMAETQCSTWMCRKLFQENLKNKSYRENWESKKEHLRKKSLMLTKAVFNWPKIQ